MSDADLVLLAGRVHTASATAAPAADAVAVRTGRVVAVGPRAELGDRIGRRTQVIDLPGRLVAPGFQNAHVHPVAAGLQLLRCDLTGAASAEDCLRMVRTYAARHPRLGWLVGGGWATALFPGGLPHRRDLDRVLPDRPAYLLDGDQHNAWVNSAALARARLDRGTPDPVQGRIGRDPDGELNGCLHESACELVGRLIPAPGAGQLLTALRAGQDVLHAHGVTAWHDALVGPYLGVPDPFETYLSAAGAGTIDWRVSGALWWDRDRSLDQLDELVTRREQAAGVGLRMHHVKIMQDGICENRTAALGEPYADAPACCAHPSGMSFLSPEQLAEAVTALEQHGFSAHFHAVGDRAVRECLDAVAAARQVNGTRPHRHQIAHVQVVCPTDLPRFAELGVTATIQPLWAAAIPQMTDLIMPALGARRSGWQYPFAALREAGARLAAGSDWPVSSPNPILGIHVAATRRPSLRSAPWLYGHDDLPAFLPEQAIPVTAALDAYTGGAAYVTGTDHLTGVIEPGRMADLVVLNNDLLTCPSAEIEHCYAELTLVAGQVVYAAESGSRSSGEGEWSVR
jgi:predicted amidohydrolase YtcJ